MEITKICSRCHRELTLSSFSGKSRSPSGFAERCKQCSSEASRESREKRMKCEAEGIWFGRVKMYPVVDGLKLCPYCGAKKPVDQFDKKESGKDRLRTRCVACSRDFTVQSRSTVRGFLKYKRDVTLSNSTTGNRKTREEFLSSCHVTVDDLIDIWNAQNGLCAVTRIPMTHENGEGWIWTNASIDRIDNSVGYSKDNVRLVCTAVNIMRNKMNDAELLWWSKAVADGLSTQKIESDFCTT